MSNLGWYQILTTAAKKVGGPKNLIGILLGTGAILGGGAVKIKNEVDKKINEKQKAAKAAKVYIVEKEGYSNEGLHFKKGDTFKLLEADGDVGLIEIIGDNKSPYYVSLKFLSTISNYMEV